MTDRRVAEKVGSEWGWEAHKRAQGRRFADASLADKIAWLEQAQQVVLTLARHRSSAPSSSPGPTKPPSPG
jgi:hypothetical protein